METTITTITISLVAILFIIYCIVEFIISRMPAGIIISDDERAYYYEQNIIKGHCKYIYDSLMVEDKFSFPLASKNINKYTIFGKMLFTILWIGIIGVPFIVGNILAIIILILIYVVRKLCFKPEDDESER